MRERIYILLVLMLGIAMPTTALACASKTTKAHSSAKLFTDLAKEHCAEKCCQNSKKIDDCIDRCVADACECAISNCNSAVAIFPHIASNNFHIPFEKERFSAKQPGLLWGFSSIWSPPNISEILAD